MGEIVRVALVDILLLLIAVVAAVEQLLIHARRGLQIEHAVRRGDAEKVIFKVEQPVKVPLPLRLRELRALVDGVGGGISVGNDDAAVFIEFAPVFLERSIAIHCKESGRGIGIHVAGIRAEVAREIHFDERGGIGVIVRKGDLTHVLPLLTQTFKEQLRLRGLAAAVKTFDDNERSPGHVRFLRCNAFFPFQFTTGARKIQQKQSCASALLFVSNQLGTAVQPSFAGVRIAHNAETAAGLGEGSVDPLSGGGGAARAGGLPEDGIAAGNKDERRERIAGDEQEPQSVRLQLAAPKAHSRLCRGAIREKGEKRRMRLNEDMGNALHLHNGEFSPQRLVRK